MALVILYSKILFCILSWCNRIFPIQATCDLKKEELATVVEKLVLQFMNDKKNKLGEHVKVPFIWFYCVVGFVDDFVYGINYKLEYPLFSRSSCWLCSVYIAFLTLCWEFA